LIEKEEKDMVHPVSMQHILTNSSTAEKVQQSNYTQTDGQQKHLATKLQKEKRLQKQKLQEMEKSDQVKIKKEKEKEKEKEKQNREELSQQQKSKAKDPKADIPAEESEDSRPEGVPKIDILV